MIVSLKLKPPLGLMTPKKAKLKNKLQWKLYGRSKVVRIPKMYLYYQVNTDNSPDKILNWWMNADKIKPNTSHLIIFIANKPQKE